MILVSLLLFTGRSISVDKDKIPYLVWNACFFASCCLTLMLVYTGPKSMDQFIKYGWIAAVGVSLVLAVRNRSNLYAVGYGILASVSLLAVLSIMEFMDPNFQVIVDRFFEDASEVGDLNRSGALYENSNNNGHVMVLGMFVGQFFLPARLRLLFFALVGAAIFCTVSRASMTVWAVAVLLTLLLGFGSTKNRIAGRVLGACFVVILAALLVSGELPNVLVQLNLDQYMSRGMLTRLSENFFTQSDGSTEVRADLAVMAWGMFVNNPVIGAGLGATEGMILHLGAHNQFLKIGGEQGLFGMLVFLSIMALALYKKSAVAVVFVLLYFALSFTSHGMLSYPAFAILIPTAVVFLPVVLKPEKNRRRRRRKRSREDDVTSLPVKQA